MKSGNAPSTSWLTVPRLLREPHRLLAVGGKYPLTLTGGYAVQAHGLVDRLSQDLDVATEYPERMDNIATAVRIGLDSAGGRSVLWKQTRCPRA